MNYKMVIWLAFCFFVNMMLCSNNIVNVMHFYDFPKRIWTLACFLESAQNKIANSTIIIHTDRNVLELAEFIKTTENIDENRIEIKTVDIDLLLNKYGMSAWNNKMKNTQQKLYMQHVSDVIRLIALHEMGGVYLDADHIMLERVNLHQYIPFVSEDLIWENINNSLMGFEKGHPILIQILDAISRQHYYGWGAFGPDMFTKFFKNTEYVKITSTMNGSAMHYYSSERERKGKKLLKESDNFQKACPSFALELLREV